MFGKKNANKTKGGQTVLVLDVEQGGVGGALVRLSRDELPQLLVETRVSLPPLSARDGRVLQMQIEGASREVLARVHTVAARLRNYPGVAGLGVIEHAAAFLSAPWGTPNFSRGKPDFVPSMKNFLVAEIGAFAPEVPLVFLTGIHRATGGLDTLSLEGGVLVCMVGSEVTELLFVGEDGPRGYATIPHGSGNFFRTLKTHGGLTEAQIHSLFLLVDTDSHERYEPLDAAGRHFVEQFADAAQNLLAEGGAAHVVVVAQEPLGEWLAKVLGGDLANPFMKALFPQGGNVIAMPRFALLNSLSAIV